MCRVPKPELLQVLLKSIKASSPQSGLNGFDQKGVAHTDEASAAAAANSKVEEAEHDANLPNGKQLNRLIANGLQNGHAPLALHAQVHALSHDICCN